VLAYNPNAAPPLTISIFVMAGCPACEDYKPRFRRIYTEMQQRGHQMPPLEFVDVNAANQQDICNHYQIKYTPTTLFQRGDGYWWKWDAPQSDESIAWLLARATQGARFAP
jgi:thiol-disulfide isomerase/thioredoxin